MILLSGKRARTALIAGTLKTASPTQLGPRITMLRGSIDPFENEVSKRFEAPYLSRNSKELKIAPWQSDGVFFRCYASSGAKVDEVPGAVLVVVGKYFLSMRPQSHSVECVEEAFRLGDPGEGR